MKELLEQQITRIDGELSLTLSNNKVLIRSETGRPDIRNLLIGKPYTEAPLIVSKTSEISSLANMLASITAFEKLFRIEERVALSRLRKILLLGQLIQNHTHHFFWEILPDYLGHKSLLDLKDDNSNLYRLGMTLMSLGSEVITTFGGRSIHPLTLEINSFGRIDLLQVKNLKKKIETSMPLFLEMLEIAANLNYPTFLKRDVEFSCLQDEKSYSLLNGKITSTLRIRTNVSNWDKNFKRKEGMIKLHDSFFCCGPLARLNLQKEFLRSRTKKAIKGLEVQIDYKNPYHSVLAEAIELFNSADKVTALMEKVLDSSGLKKLTPYTFRAGETTGAVESPNGTIYQAYKISKEGLIEDFDIMTATIQNKTMLQKDIKTLIESTEDFQAEKRERLLEMLIRAYNPVAAEL